MIKPLSKLTKKKREKTKIIKIKEKKEHDCQPNSSNGLSISKDYKGML